jgi:hypothetical protein
VLARELAITAHETDRVVLETGELPCGPDVAARLAPADRAIVVGATVGQPGCAILCWPGSAQWPNNPPQQIFGLLDPGGEADDVIELTASQLIKPAKSLSFLVGLTDEPVSDDEACDTCGLIPVCNSGGC